MSSEVCPAPCSPWACWPPRSAPASAAPKAAAPKSGGHEAKSDDLATLPGFKVETILKADPKVNGSWISLAKDRKGRLLLGGQRGQPVTRVTIKDGKVEKAEPLKLPVSEVMGMLDAFDSLYVDGHRRQDVRPVPPLLPRRRRHLRQAELLIEWKGGSGEHGAHGIVAGPDKKLYTVCGNFTTTAEAN